MTKSSEPCISCGDDTAVGSPFYFDRRVLDPDGPNRSYMCSSCVERIMTGRRRHPPMSEKERLELENAAAAFGGFAPGGH